MKEKMPKLSLRILPCNSIFNPFGVFYYHKVTLKIVYLNSFNSVAQFNTWRFFLLNFLSFISRNQVAKSFDFSSEETNPVK